jgi:hypothetical protein
MSQGQKLPAATVQPIALELVDLLQPACEWFSIGGSLRRQSNTVGDVEVIVIPKDEYWTLTDKLLADGVVTHAKPKGWGPKYRKMMFRGVKFDVFLCDEMNRGYIHWLRTGPAEANQALVTLIKDKAPFAVQDGYVWMGEKRLRINLEDDWFDLLGIPFIEPKNRNAGFYHKLFKEKSHQYGDPTRYLPPVPKQTAMFTSDQLQDFEWRAAQRHEDATPGKDVKKSKADLFEWEKPWLCADGKVWVHVGYGQYEAFPQDDPRALTRLCVLRNVGAVQHGDRIQLESWLMLRDARLKQEAKLAQVLMQLVSVLRDAA